MAAAAAAAVAARRLRTRPRPPPLPGGAGRAASGSAPSASSAPPSATTEKSISTSSSLVGFFLGVGLRRDVRRRAAAHSVQNRCVPEFGRYSSPHSTQRRFMWASSARTRRCGGPRRPCPYIWRSLQFEHHLYRSDMLALHPAHFLTPSVLRSPRVSIGRSATASHVTQYAYGSVSVRPSETHSRRRYVELEHVMHE